ncbi:MAG: tRNA-dihydrouridine synthase, partial [Acidobacteriota bacterium]
MSSYRSRSSMPVTVKHRIGIDDLDRYEDMLRFVDVVAAAGADRLSVHARKAWLQGLSPKENREIPPLRYEDVYRLKRERPGLVVEINGGVVDLEQTRAHLERVDAVMIGRAAYENPYLFAEVDRRFFDPASPVRSKREVIEAMKSYAGRHVASGLRLGYITRHMTQLCHRHAGARGWRRHLSEHGHRAGAGVEVLDGAMARVPDEILDHRGAGLPTSASTVAAL